MNNYLDDYMYYNGGINPYYMYEIYGRGGLGYKPHDYIDGGTLRLTYKGEEYENEDAAKKILSMSDKYNSFIYNENLIDKLEDYVDDPKNKNEVIEDEYRKNDIIKSLHKKNKELIGTEYKQGVIRTDLKIIDAFLDDYQNNPTNYKLGDLVKKFRTFEDLKLGKYKKSIDKINKMFTGTMYNDPIEEALVTERLQKFFNKILSDTRNRIMIKTSIDKLNERISKPPSLLKMNYYEIKNPDLKELLFERDITLNQLNAIKNKSRTITYSQYDSRETRAKKLIAFNNELSQRDKNIDNLEKKIDTLNKQIEDMGYKPFERKNARVKETITIDYDKIIENNNPPEFTNKLIKWAKTFLKNGYSYTDIGIKTEDKLNENKKYLPDNVNQNYIQSSDKTADKNASIYYIYDFRGKTMDIEIKTKISYSYQEINLTFKTFWDIWDKKKDLLKFMHTYSQSDIGVPLTTNKVAGNTGSFVPYFYGEIGNLKLGGVYDKINNKMITENIGKDVKVLFILNDGTYLYDFTKDINCKKNIDILENAPKSININGKNIQCFKIELLYPKNEFDEYLIPPFLLTPYLD